jgi:hypothetical protein
VCGSESTYTAYWQNLKRLGQALLKVLGRGVGLVIVGLVWWYFLLTPKKQSLKQRLADEYKVTRDQVFIAPKPYGCDFGDAPLGNKHCHFEKVVDVERACPAPDCRVTAVYVSWRKVEE